MEPKLSIELTHHRYLRERLEAAFPDADEETLLDTLEGMTSLTDSLAELLRSSQEDQSLASALRSRLPERLHVGSRPRSHGRPVGPACWLGSQP